MRLYTTRAYARAKAARLNANNTFAHVDHYRCDLHDRFQWSTQSFRDRYVIVVVMTDGKEYPCV